MTDWLITGRNAGKTLFAVEQFVATPDSTLVVFNEHERRRIIDLISRCFGAANATARASDILTPGYASRLRGRPSGPVFADNADLILAGLFGQDIELATATGSLIRHQALVDRIENGHA